MKETKQASGTAYAPESGARAAMHEMMAAFEAFKGANDARLDEIERKSSADALLEEKVARIDQAVGAAQDRLERLSAEARRALLARTARAAARGEYELFKTSSIFDATATNPEWLGEEPERVQAVMQG